MKRKLFTTLLALAAAMCLCLGLAACGNEPETPQDPQTPEDPPAETGSVEGYWTGATAQISLSDASDPAEMTFAAGVKLVGDTAYVVLEIVEEGGTSSPAGLVGYVLAKQADGTYTFTYDPQSDFGHVAGKLTADGKLEIVTDMLSPSAQEALTLTFTAKTELAAGLGLTGTWYELIGLDGANYSYTAGKNRYDFTNQKLYAFESEQALTVVEVGKYTLFTYPDQMPQIIFRSGDEYFVGDMHLKLTQTAPAE